MQGRVLNMNVNLVPGSRYRSHPDAGAGVPVPEGIHAVEFRLGASIKELAVVEYRVDRGGSVFARYLPHVHAAHVEHRVGNQRG